VKNNYILALLSAFLLWLAWPPIPYTSPVLWIAFLPLLIAIERIIQQRDLPKKGRKIYATAFLTAVVWNTASIYWVYHSISAIMPWYIALLICIIPFGLGSSLMALAFSAYYQLRKKANLALSLLGLSSFWIAYEYLHQSWDLAFPWMTLGNGFANFHQLIQWYEITGVYGGTIWVWLINSCVFVAYLQYRNQKLSWSIVGAIASSILLPTAYSIYRYQSYEEHINPAQVVIVQPNIDPFGKFGYISKADQLQTLIRLSKSVAKPNTEFFIWPETAISSDGYIDEDEYREASSYLQILSFLDQYKNGNVLSGIESVKFYSDQRTATARPVAGRFVDSFNAAVLIDDSSKLQFYHKSKLVPGVEQTPFGSALKFLSPLFKAFGGTTGGYGKQDEPSVFYAQSGIGAAPVICYESIWGDYVAKYTAQGAQFIAIITNDGWWGNSSGKDQHLDYARLRAIENRRWVARSANTGISASINQRGDIVQRTKWWEEAAINQEINLNEEISPYVRYGDMAAYLGLLSALAAGIFIIIPSKKQKF